MDNVTHLQRHMPWIRHIRKWAPLSLVRMFPSRLGDYIVTSRLEPTDTFYTLFESTGAKNCPISLAVLNSDIPEYEKTPERLIQDSYGTTMAAIRPSSAALNTVMYQLLSNPKVYQRLREELQNKIGDAKHLPCWTELEELPYLSAVIHESLRMLYDAGGERLPYDTSQERSPRVATEEDLVYESASGDAKHVIPRGYAVSMSPYIIHTNEDLFPNASQFMPERWLAEKGQKNTGLERRLLSFGRGSRSCVAISVAYCSLYVAVAAVALRVLPSLELCNTVSTAALAAQSSLKKKRKFKGFMVRVLDT
ncbi:MAG: hypothetical protein L6R40_000841 [Gallowayella cf. fulva]|nr:MAG: hypothetical protein L6R40_000841 [Xanthomendoza cf. fulva]